LQAPSRAASVPSVQPAPANLFTPAPQPASAQPPAPGPTPAPASGPSPAPSPSPTPQTSTGSKSATAQSERAVAPAESRTISGGVLNSKALNLPKPSYPAAAKQGGVYGLVVVAVTVDERGRVTEAKAVSGPILLHTAAVTAARQARFSPTTLSGAPVKVTGTISYNFIRQ
jgi:periplasmic protein TonB